jgi:hypothetical protein
MATNIVLKYYEGKGKIQRKNGGENEEMCGHERYLQSTQVTWSSRVSHFCIGLLSDLN